MIHYRISAGDLAEDSIVFFKSCFECIVFIFYEFVDVNSAGRLNIIVHENVIGFYEINILNQFACCLRGWVAIDKPVS